MGFRSDKRSLTDIKLIPPDYRVPDISILIHGYLEKEIKIAGVLNNIPCTLDMNSRCEVLKHIDKGKARGDVIWNLNGKNDSVISVSATNIKLVRRDDTLDVFLRIHINEIAAICYIKDDDLHLVAIKFTDDQENIGYCKLCVLLVHEKENAEELCSLVKQCFEIMYTDSSRYFEDRMYSGNATPRTSISYPDTSISNMTGDFRTIGYPTLYSTNSGRDSDTSSSDSEDGERKNEILDDYMNKLQERLSTEELKRYAVLMKARYESGMPFPDFCNSIRELYGRDRIFLLSGMRPFIPAEDKAFFENFLRQIGIEDDRSWNEAFGKRPQVRNRTLSEDLNMDSIRL
ncbi:DgyrCDS403 [Dimorphilus gyrociliatus]|uniref:DgyrCDS403 n=1 Tax=Dimorphilus gyrociliatus TaxID=2664684 RepID=A0A7I8V4J1_9ANNE|nr:DgyrCDS403 [Dimorphilus gyrociliatus]